MPRPKNKSELLELGQINYNRLITYIDELSIDEQNKEFLPDKLNRNIRDVLAHLHHWNLMMISWHKEGMTGRKPNMPAKGYTWKTVPALNIVINKKYNKTSLKKVKTLLAQSFEEIQKIIGQHDSESLFTKKKYKWTGSTSLGAYFTSSTSSHYEWAFQLIKKNQ